MSKRRLFTTLAAFILVVCMGCSNALGQSAEQSWVVAVSHSPQMASGEPATTRHVVILFDTLRNPYEDFRQSLTFKGRSLILPLAVSLGVGGGLGAIAYRDGIKNGGDPYFSDEHVATFQFNMVFFLGSGIAYGLTDAFINAPLRKLPIEIQKGAFGAYLAPYLGLLLPAFLISYTKAYVMGSALVIVSTTVAAASRFGRIDDNLESAAKKWNQENVRLQPAFGGVRLPGSGAFVPTAGVAVRF